MHGVNVLGKVVELGTCRNVASSTCVNPADRDVTNEVISEQYCNVDERHSLYSYIKMR